MIDVRPRKGQTRSNMALSKQLSVRLSDAQREYVQEQAEELKSDPSLAHVKWGEGDVVRSLIEVARRSGQRVADSIKEGKF
jgi:hypothetical protein